MRRTLRSVLVALLGVALVAPVAAAQYHRPSLVVLGVETAVAAAAFAGSDHLLDSPSSWGQDGAGYRRRVDVRLVQFTVATGAEVALLSWSDADARYRPSAPHTAPWPRVTRVVSRALVVDQHGRSRPAWEIVGASLLGAASSAPLLPSRYRASWILTRPLTTLAARAALFGWYEFAPTALGGRRGGTSPAAGHSTP